MVNMNIIISRYPKSVIHYSTFKVVDACLTTPSMATTTYPTTSTLAVSSVAAVPVIMGRWPIWLIDEYNLTNMASGPEDKYKYKYSYKCDYGGNEEHST